jgi:hypothetical protein
VKIWLDERWINGTRAAVDLGKTVAELVLLATVFGVAAQATNSLTIEIAARLAHALIAVFFLHYILKLNALSERSSTRGWGLVLVATGMLTAFTSWVVTRMVEALIAANVAG